MRMDLLGVQGPAGSQKGRNLMRRRRPVGGHEGRLPTSPRRSTSDRQQLVQAGDEQLPRVLPERMAPRRKGGSEDGVDRDHRQLTR